MDALCGLLCRMEFSVISVIPVACMLGGFFVSLSSQNSFILSISFVASILILSVVDQVIRVILRRKEVFIIVIGDSLLYDGLGLLVLCALMTLIFRMQKKVAKSSLRHI